MGNFGDCAPQRAVTLIRKSCRSDESLKTSVVAGVFSFLEYEITLDLQRSSSTHQPINSQFCQTTTAENLYFSL